MDHLALDSGFLHEWNEHCRKTFPKDAVQVGDLLFCVNGHRSGENGDLPDSGNPLLDALRDTSRDRIVAVRRPTYDV